MPLFEPGVCCFFCSSVKAVRDGKYTCFECRQVYQNLSVEHKFRLLAYNRNELFREKEKLVKVVNEEHPRIVKELQDEIASLKDAAAASQPCDDPEKLESDQASINHDEGEVVKDDEAQHSEEDEQQASTKETPLPTVGETAQDRAASGVASQIQAAFLAAEEAVTKAKSAFKLIEQGTTDLESMMRQMQRAFLTLPPSDATHANADDAAAESA